jgi:hypothetical protein
MDFFESLHLGTYRNIPSRLLFAAIFAVATMTFVNQATEFYFKNIDKTEYFSVKQPVSIDKNEYLSCEPILVDLVRTSVITTRAVSTVEIILVNDKGEWFKQTIGGSDFNIDKSQGQVIHVRFVLPCDIIPGQYFLKAVVHYEVRGMPKDYVWESESFQVILGTPEEQKEATASPFLR